MKFIIWLINSFIFYVKWGKDAIKQEYKTFNLKEGDILSPTDINESILILKNQGINEKGNCNYIIKYIKNK